MHASEVPPTRALWLTVELARSSLGLLTPIEYERRRASRTEAKSSNSDPGNAGHTRWRELRKVYGEDLVKRSALLKIAAAWSITDPPVGIMSARLFYMARGMMLPRELAP